MNVGASEIRIDSRCEIRRETWLAMSYPVVQYLVVNFGCYLKPSYHLNRRFSRVYLAVSNDRFLISRTHVDFLTKKAPSDKSTCSRVIVLRFKECVKKGICDPARVTLYSAAVISHSRILYTRTRSVSSYKRVQLHSSVVVSKLWLENVFCAAVIAALYSRSSSSSHEIHQ